MLKLNQRIFREPQKKKAIFRLYRNANAKNRFWEEPNHSRETRRQDPDAFGDYLGRRQVAFPPKILIYVFCTQPRIFNNSNFKINFTVFTLTYLGFQGEFGYVVDEIGGFSIKGPPKSFLLRSQVQEVPEESLIYIHGVYQRVLLTQRAILLESAKVLYIKGKKYLKALQ